MRFFYLPGTIDDYAKNGGPGEVRLLCSFYHESLHTLNKTILNKFAVSNHTALISGVHALRSYLKLICKYDLHRLPNKKVSGAKEHGQTAPGPPSFASSSIVKRYLNSILKLKKINFC